MTVKEMREARGLSQTAVAAELGVEQPYYSKIERGLANPTFDKTTKLASILDVGIGELAEQLARTRASVVATLPDASDLPGYLSWGPFGVAALTSPSVPSSAAA